MLIRPESAADRSAVQALITAAFARPESVGESVVEAVLNDELRLDPDLVSPLTLVAERDGEIVGQVTCSYGAIVERTGVQRRVIGVGPVSVLPRCQGEGIGSALIWALIDLARESGEPGLVLLGSPDFYGRFGFVAASELGIAAPDRTWGRYFQALRLRPEEPVPAGDFRYSAPFDRL